jgi:hypothetical protein
MCTCDGTDTGFCLANPKLHGERGQAQRLLALNTCIWHNWLIDAPVKRSLIAYDHYFAGAVQIP